MISDEILIMLSKIWKPLIAIVGTVVGGLYLFYKGKSSSDKQHAAERLQDEVIKQKEVIDEINRTNKRWGEIDKVYDAAPDDWTHRVQ